MSKYLYFKTDKFKSNENFASWLHSELLESGETPAAAIDNDYMFIIPVKRNGELINIYLGKNDEECTPPMWQAWAELKVGKLRSIFKKPDMQQEEALSKKLGEIVSKIDGVTDVEWSSI